MQKQTYFKESWEKSTSFSVIQNAVYGRANGGGFPIFGASCYVCRLQNAKKLKSELSELRLK